MCYLHLLEVSGSKLLKLNIVVSIITSFIVFVKISLEMLIVFSEGNAKCC